MKPFASPARREIALILVISLLALAPLLFLGFKSVFGPRPTPTTAMVKPVLNAMTRGKGGSLTSNAFLSPDGRWIARMELSPSKIGVPDPPGAITAQANDLVIRSARSGQEAFRAFVAGGFVSWVPQSLNFVAQTGLDITLFSPATRKPGASPPLEPWVATPLSFPGNHHNGGFSSRSGSASVGFITGAVAFSPDGRFAVQAAWGNGEVEWQVADLTTGKIAAPVKIGRWLGFDPQGKGRSGHVSISVAPASLASRALPVVAFLQEVVNPQAVPTPRPTWTPAQHRFTERYQREMEEDFRRMEKMMADPRGRRNFALTWRERFARRRILEAERSRLFPLSPQEQRRRNQPRLSDAKLFQVECFDIGKRQKIWSAPLRSRTFAPHHKFSPDGAALVVWNTTRLTGDKYNRRPYLKDSGIELFAAATGKHRARFRLYEKDFSSPELDQAVFYRQAMTTGSFHSILTLLDSRNIALKASRSGARTRTVPILRFFDTSTAREVGYLDIDAPRLDREFQNRIAHFSTDDNGFSWLFGEGDSVLFSRSQLGRESFAPLPHPTPFPTPFSTSSPRKF